MFDNYGKVGYEEWQTYAECVREVMVQAGNLKKSNQPFRDKLLYEDLMFDPERRQLLNLDEDRS